MGVAGVKTVQNPDTLPNAGVVPVVVFGIASLALLAGFIWLLGLNRRAAGKSTG